MDSKNEESLQTLNRENYTEIKNISDGNFFYRCISQAMDNYQDNYLYYRHLIFVYIYIKIKKN